MNIRKCLSVIFPVILLLLVIANCKKQQVEDKIALPLPEEYRTWNMTTETVLNYPVPGHRDNCRMIYINTIGESPKISEQNGRVHHEYPEGAMIVKEVYKGLDPPEEHEEPFELTVMLKAPRHPKAQQGWLWIMKDVESGNVSIVERKICIECHANANETHPYGDRNPDSEFRDFVFFPPRSEPVTD